MGMLYIRVGGAWVPYGPSGSVTPPAKAGPREAPWETQARFGHQDADGSSGFIAHASGVIEVIRSSGRHTFASSDGSVMDLSFDNSIIIHPQLSFGIHPAWGWAGIWDTSTGGFNDYRLMFHNNDTRVNARGGSLVLGVSQDDHLVCGSGSIGIRKHTEVTLNTGGNNSWGASHLLLYPNASGSECPRVGFHSNGVAPQVRSQATQGSRIAAVNENGDNWAPIQASSFEVNSTITMKREVRTLRPERERIVVRHDWQTEVVPMPDIMALRPVAFRPKIGQLRIVPTDPDGDYDTVVPGDPDTFRVVPQIGLLGREGSRERLGLIAEEVHHVIPSAVTHDIDEKCMGIDYAQITVALLDHVQRLTDEVATLRYRVAELEGSPA